MPAWPEKRTYIGSHAKRIDAPAKVTGAAKYASDAQPEGWLYGMILRSKWPNFEPKPPPINSEITRTLFWGTLRLSARPSRTVPIPCVEAQQVTSSSVKET